MPKTNSSLTLDPNYYSASSYEEEETSPPLYRRAVFPILTVFIILGIVFFSYQVIKKYNSSIVSWWTELEIIPKLEEDPVIKDNKEKVVKISNLSTSVGKNEEAIMVKSNIVASIPILTTATEEDALSEEYLKLVKESLGELLAVYAFKYLKRLRAKHTLMI